MTKQTPDTAEIEKWLRFRLRFSTKFWLYLHIRKKYAESLWSRFPHSGSMATSGAWPSGCCGQEMAQHVIK